LKPQCSPYVNSGEKEWNLKMKAMTENARRYVKVAPPTVHAGVGDALREAYRIDGETRCLEPFKDLLRRLD